MSKKKSKGEAEAGQAPAEESQVRPDEVTDVKPKKKGKPAEGRRRRAGPGTAAPHPEEAAEPKRKMAIRVTRANWRSWRSSLSNSRNGSRSKD